MEDPPDVNTPFRHFQPSQENHKQILLKTPELLTQSRSATVTNVKNISQPRGKNCVFITFSVALILNVLVISTRYARTTDEFHSISRHLDENATDVECEDSSSSSSFAWVAKVPKGLQFTLIGILILFSAFFSGLTLALMGLDTIQLEIVKSGDNPVLSRAARKIYPVRKNGNVLLCTLLLGNVAVNTLLGILMADITGGTIGFFSSTFLIVIFGEIIPQALFSRYALQVGERAVPIVKVIIFLLYILAKPLAFCLDKLLGHELGTTYSKAEMSKLLEIHVKEGRFNAETGSAMKGALKYQDIAVKDVMTPIENTFMLNVEEKLNFATMSTIFKTGYSRIPIYEASVSNVIGLLFVKDLIFIDPDDETPVRNFVEIFGRGSHTVWPEDKLGDVLSYLRKGHTHMALVRDVNNASDTQDPFYELKGIITLEDIIEEILGEEILDETDAWVDGEHLKKVNRTAAFDWARLRLLDSKIVDQTLSEEEVRAVAAHLRTNHADAVRSLSEKQLPRMIAATPVTELPEAIKEVGQVLPSNLLYEKNVPCDVCTLILSGKVTVVAGNDNFRSDISAWSVLGTNALEDEKYVPDFSAYVSSGPCRCLRFTRKIFTAAADQSVLEKLPSQRVSTVTSDVDLPSVDEPGQVAVVVEKLESSQRNTNPAPHVSANIESRTKLLEALYRKKEKKHHVENDGGKS